MILDGTINSLCEECDFLAFLAFFAFWCPWHHQFTLLGEWLRVVSPHTCDLWLPNQFEADLPLVQTFRHLCVCFAPLTAAMAQTQTNPTMAAVAALIAATSAQQPAPPPPADPKQGGDTSCLIMNDEEKLLSDKYTDPIASPSHCLFKQPQIKKLMAINIIEPVSSLVSCLV